MVELGLGHKVANTCWCWHIPRFRGSEMLIFHYTRGGDFL
jgi:hypothetical protein